jgi:hypothetical protein
VLVGENPKAIPGRQPYKENEDGGKSMKKTLHRKQGRETTLSFQVIGRQPCTENKEER